MIKSQNRDIDSQKETVEIEKWIHFRFINQYITMFFVKHLIKHAMFFFAAAQIKTTLETGQG